jgi:hypothetical protein
MRRQQKNYNDDCFLSIDRKPNGDLQLKLGRAFARTVISIVFAFSGGAAAVGPAATLLHKLLQ